MVTPILVGILSAAGIALLGYLGTRRMTSHAMRRAAIDRRKRKALLKVRAEGRAARERILSVTHEQTGVGMPFRARKGRPATHKARFIIPAFLLVAIPVAVIVPKVWLVHATTPRGDHMYNRNVDPRVGDCVDYAAQTAKARAPRHPHIVGCAHRDATFRIVWLGHSTAANPCPTRYSNTQRWSHKSEITACLTRVYHAGQCMRGPKNKPHRVTWYNNAVVKCSWPVTRQDPYLVRITKIVNDGDAGCPPRRYVEPEPGSHGEFFLCVRLARVYRG